MKILMAGWGFDKKITGGMDIHITHLVKNLCAQGAEIHLILPKENAPEAPQKNLTIHKIDTNAKDPEELDKNYTSAIIALSESTGFDIIHTHDWFGVTAAKKLKKDKSKITTYPQIGWVGARKRAGKKIIPRALEQSETHLIVNLSEGCGTSQSTKGDIDYNKLKPIRWIHTVHSLEYMRCAKDAPTKSKISEIEETAIKESDAVITVSKLMKQKIHIHYNIDPKKINVIYNYTSQLPKAPETKKQAVKDSNKDTTKNNSPCARAKRTSDLNRRFMVALIASLSEGCDQPFRRLTPIVLCVSRLTFQKGIEYLIHASTDILKQIPDCRFIIIGEGYLKESLENFAGALGVQNSFEFPGFVQDKELAAHFRSATLFIMPSIHEPFGIACLDAIDANLPVILSEKVGAKELFPGCTLIHKSCSKEDIAKNTIKLLKDRQLRETLADSAKQKLDKTDNWSTIAKKTVAIYTSV